MLPTCGSILNNVLWVTFLATSALASQALPTVTFPWGTWQANSISPMGNDNIIAFQNIRFGQAPVGSLRFQKPIPPLSVPYPDRTFWPNTQAPMCIQASGTDVKCPNQSPTTTTTTTKTSCSTRPTQINQSEDCLFMDVYVPESVWSSREKLARTPVVVWIFGGAYIEGAKDEFGSALPFYNASGIMTAAQQIYGKSFIFVTGNYRLGAYGWLAGPTMEDKGTPNAGLYDQRLVLKTVNQHIKLFGGDNTQVSVWGESAGAGSIMHHITGNWSETNLFQRAFLQSPAFEWQYNRLSGGTLQQRFTQFANAAGCPGNDGSQLWNCLSQTASADQIKKANQAVANTVRSTGLYPYGPAVDKTTILQLPVLALQNNKFSQKLSSLAISHVKHESFLFEPKCIKDEKDFDAFLEAFIPETVLRSPNGGVIQKIKNQYPWKNFILNAKGRAGAIIRDSTFVCNTRQLYDAFSSSIRNGVNMMSYGFGGPYGITADHAFDLLPTFTNADFDVFNFFKSLCLSKEELAAIDLAYLTFNNMVPQYQAYLAGLALGGDPNLLKNSKTNFNWTDWLAASVTSSCDSGHHTNCLKNVLDVESYTPQFNNSAVDNTTSEDICSFWNSIASDIWTTLYPSKIAGSVPTPAPTPDQFIFNEL